MFDESRLDDLDLVEALDTTSTLRALASAGAHVRRAVVAARESGIERLAGDRPRGIVVAAAGGSAVVGDLLEALTRSGSAIPVQTCSSGPLPGWVGPLDLVIALSRSGRAPAALATAAEAARRGASLLGIGAADSPLHDVVARARGVHVPLDVATSSSRTAMWAQAAPVVLAADAIGLLDGADADLDAVADVLDEAAAAMRPTSEAFINPAKVLAADIGESMPIALGVGPLGGVAARRAAVMVGRTGRVPMVAGALPDAASQVVATFDGLFASGDPGSGVGFAGSDIFADPFLDAPSRPPLRLVLLEDGPDSPHLDLTQRVVRAAEGSGVRVSRIAPVDGPPLARLAGHVARTDFAAAYLAIGCGFDPAVSPHVRLLRD